MYENRDKTILRKQGVDRNYNSRIYMFQLEYFVDNKRIIYKDTDWENLVETTGFLTEAPKEIISKI